jgi:hypothetical protein
MSCLTDNLERKIFDSSGLIKNKTRFNKCCIYFLKLPILNCMKKEFVTVNNLQIACYIKNHEHSKTIFLFMAIHAHPGFGINNLLILFFLITG